MEMQRIEPNSKTMLGVVNWFDKSLGYGFVNGTDGSEDILLHANTLNNFGASTALPGSAIEFEYARTEKGMRVVNVLSLSNSQTAQPTQRVNLDAEMHGELEPVKVRWYNVNNGYGFVNRFDDKQDIFIGSSILAKYGRSKLANDEAISARIRGSGKDAHVYEIGIW